MKQYEVIEATNAFGPNNNQMAAKLRTYHVRRQCHVLAQQRSRSWWSLRLCAAMLLLICSAPAAATSGSTHSRCNADQFQCRDGGCILQAKMCDGRSDCTDNSDELECDYKLCRQPHWFPCAQPHGACLAQELICNGIENCPGGEDERHCAADRLFNFGPRNCSQYEYMCQDHSCIPLDFMCDGKADCDDHSDEIAGCKQSAASCLTGHLCNNGRCLQRKQWLCDGIDDCGDGSDERDCPNLCQPSLGKFLCRNRETCLNLSQVCDGQSNCSDGSDESESCHVKPDCSTTKCPPAASCHMMPTTGPECYCPSGYRLMALQQKCEDINECEERDDLCSQRCENNSGDFRCACDAGYQLDSSNNRTCHAIDLETDKENNNREALLLYTTQMSVVGMRLQRQAPLRNHVFTIASNLSKVIGVAYDGEHIYWTNIQHEVESIVRARADGSNAEILLTSGLDAPEDLAVDWLTDNIYISDNVMRHIAVCSSDAVTCVVLVTQDVHQPRGLALWPQRGQMFWTDWGNKPMIARASMDGTRSRPIVSDNIHWPNGIALDMHQERVYWVDAKLGTIETARADGTARRIVLDGMLKHPYGMAVFEDQLYWSDWGTKSVHACHKFTGKGHRILVRDRSIYAVHVYHPSKQPQLSHPCETARCSHLCLLTEKDAGGYSCACPDGMQLSDTDQRSCRQVEKKQRLFVGMRQVLLEIEHTSFGRHVVSASHILHCYISELVYNPINGTIFIADNVQRALFLYDPHESMQHLTTLIYGNLGNISSLAFDHLARNLYWTDTERHVIELLSLQTGQRALVRFFAGQETPIGLSVMPAEGYMFVALKARRHTHIDRLALSGLGSQTHVFEDDLGDDDIKFAVDSQTHTLYWSDSDVNRISFTNYRQAHQHTFSGRFRRPYSLALVGQDLFWTELGTPAVMWTHKSNMGSHKRFEFDTGSQRIAAVPPPPRHIPLTSSVRLPLNSRSHPCQVANGGCSHVCVSAGQLGSACLCPAGFVYRDASNRTCTEALDCEFRCRASGECLTMAHRCNGHKDCADDSDETNCDLFYGGGIKTRINVNCAIDEFKCHDGEQCLEKGKRCDEHKDCKDGSDENHCSRFDRTKLCHIHQHACDNGKCVDYSLLCDGTDDCGDNSDELTTSCARPAICGSGMFQCSSGACIPSGWECDGKIDCSDASDEYEKCGKHQCPGNMHRCLLGQCVDRHLVCDGHNDCGDRSDEINCSPNAAAGLNISCGSLEHPMYQCTSNLHLCLTGEVRCNGTAECPRGEDEADCGDICGISEFQCRQSKECIRLEFRCDKERDCSDSSDEEHCEQHATAANGTASGRRTCKPHLFDCHDGECVDMSRVCDSFEDCANGSDEGPKCSSACNKHICQHMCRATPAGAVCTCRDGYRLAIDQRSCLDIDECAPSGEQQQQQPPCAQLCENTPGSYQCQCHQDFMLRQDRTSCKSIDTLDGGPSFLFTTYNEVRNLSDRHAMLSVAWSANDTRISGLDVDMRRQLGYFSSDEQHVIYQLDMRDHRPLAALSLGSPSKLAIEWTTGNAYVISGNAAQQISVCSFAAKMCGRILQLSHKHGHSTLKSLAVDAYHARLFYAVVQQENFGQPQTELYVARLDGSRRELLYRKERSYVTAMAIDPHQQQLFFVDLHTHTMEMVSYRARGNRQSRIVLQKSNALWRPMGLSIYENHAYIVNMGANELVRCRLYGEVSCTAIPLSVTNAQDIVVAGQSRQPAASSNSCEHAHCSGMCVLADYGYECMCGNEIVAESLPCPHGSTNELNIGALLSGDQGSERSESSHGMFWIILMLILGIAMMAVGIGYYQYRKRGHRDLNINLHFQNPLATRGGKSIVACDDINELEGGDSRRGSNASVNNTNSTISAKRKTIQFDVLQRFMHNKNSQNSELATEMSLENARASELQTLVNERRDSSNPRVMVAGFGDDSTAHGHHSGDFGGDDVHAQLVP